MSRNGQVQEMHGAGDERCSKMKEESRMIEAHGLTKRYGSTLAVDNLSFVVAPGRVTGFLGPNGAGKSTTLRLILGLDSPDDGAVTVGGRAYKSLERPLYNVGALLDAGAVHGGRSAYNHLLWLAKSNGINRGRVEEVLDTVGLTKVARKRVGTFSLGMRQRLGIGAALLGDPDVLILDEPVNGLDPEGIVWVRNLLRSLAAEGRTVFVSSHLMAEMAQTADRVIVIGRGRLLVEANIEDLLRRSAQSFVRVRSTQDARLQELLAWEGAKSSLAADGALSVTGLAAARIGDLAGMNGIYLHELSPCNASLEDVYMALTRDSVECRSANDGVLDTPLLASAAA
jgi:ABC-2 type transport system ATP-binding protein